MNNSLVVFLVLAASYWAQSNGTVLSPSPTETQSGTVVLTKLSPLVYPPLARQARISGDVIVRLVIRSDGSVESAQVLEGHPMLKQAALDSARKSQYECHECSVSGSSYVLTYTFGFSNDSGGVCGGSITEQRVRGPQCGYLWKCGRRQVTAWPKTSDRPSEVRLSPGHVTILAPEVCMEPQYSRAETR